MLRNTDFSTLAQVQAAGAGGPPPDQALGTGDFQGKCVLAAALAPIAPLDASIQRTGFVLLLALAGAILAALFLARRMVPIRALQAGAARIGSGELGARVEVKTGDDLGRSPISFNTMSSSWVQHHAAVRGRTWS